MITELKKNIKKGVGEGNFGYGLRKKDGSGLDFTEDTKKKLAKEREAFLRGKSKYAQFANLFTEANRAIMFRQQIGHALMLNPKKFHPELHQKVVALDKKYMQGDDPISYLNGLDQKEIHRAYLEYKGLWMQIQQWNNTHFSNQNKGYNTVIIFRYDGKAKWDDNCMSIQLVYEDGDWVINDTSVSRVFNKKEVEEMLRHCKNKQKEDAKVLILANENKDLRKVLNELGYNPKSLYSILPDTLKSKYPLLTVGEPGSPHPNSQKNMNIDVSFFYKAFGNKSSLQSLSNFAFDYENIRGILMDPDDESKYEGIEAAIDGSPIGNKYDQFADWARAHRKQVAMVGAACFGLLAALQVYSYMIHGHGILYVLFKKFNKWMSARSKMDSAIKGSPLEKEWITLQKNVENARTPEENKRAVAALTKFAKTLQSNIKKQEFSMTYEEQLEQFSIKSFLVNPKTIGTVIGTLTTALIVTKLARMNARRLNDTKELYEKVNETADKLNLAIHDNQYKNVLGKYKSEWDALYKEIKSTPDNDTRLVKQCDERLNAFGNKVVQELRENVKAIENELKRREEQENNSSNLSNFAIPSQLVFAGGVLTGLGAAIAINKMLGDYRQSVKEDEEYINKMNESADKIQYIFSKPDNKELLKDWKLEWDKLYKEVKGADKHDDREYLEKLNQRISDFGDKVIKEVKERAESKLLEVEKYRTFSSRLSNVINFSLITKRDDVLNSLRLVFKEMPKDAPQLDQDFLAIQSKYLKERMGSYDIEALKPKVQEMSESQLEACNTDLRALLKKIRNFNKNPIINKGPRGNKLPQDDDLNKFERFVRDVGKNSRNIITPIGLGAGAALTIRKLLKGN